jgi:outer membrane murein-binding lipoprotein Lpp
MRVASLCLTACLSLLLAGCDLAGPIEQQSEAAKKAAEANQLRNHIQQPIDRAKAANDPVIEADKRREQELKDAGG